MRIFNLDNKVFSPVTNSQNGRVRSDAVFKFVQSGERFTAHYFGGSVSDGHLIGVFKTEDTADIIYHSRAANGSLEAGKAVAKFKTGNDDLVHIDMDWQWLNLDQSTGRSHYVEVKNDP